MMQNDTVSSAQPGPARGHKTAFVHCPRRRRMIPVTFETTGRFFAHWQDVTDCPAMHEGPCGRECLADSPFD